ncbi:MAG: InlB B-repeat-containing protein [Clostridiales bacterium]|nr:MAG: InlB B-repeat-containing protein [Clostridiales bacterium]
MKGNTVTVTDIAASSDGKNYTLSGNFEVGKKYTVKVVLSGATVDATHQLATDEFVITPIRTSSGGGGTTRYTVSFETNGGSKISSERVNRNGTLTEPTAPTKEGFDFAGWYTDQELKTTYDFSAKGNEKHHTLRCLDRKRIIQSIRLS